ncbi:MAG: hypothetical protein P8Y93_04435 [Acidobacteriota bacterium]|jgi:hypothetical protein
MKAPVIFLVIGVLLFLLSLTADSLGLGTSPGLGLVQIVGAVIGVVIAAFGMYRLRA